ncbi:Putative DNA-binding protein ESCAROLA [Apostasia shenzhenica]|uniref:DNA-binding protein ESCAROLA n=1 Tax=Apostasia shenzhenica TaxID=1088818 RepID=A0A2H9ZV75_9ASPA|nr:Putative DNA-binding protein ESCAROLA [Apostasia shenzhenica]
MGRKKGCEEVNRCVNTRSTGGRDLPTIAPVTRSRGRPPGSKNKKKSLPVADIAKPSPSLQTYVQKIPAGEDVACAIASLASSACGANVGTCFFVIAAHGSISAAELRWGPAPVSLRGDFGLLSISATFVSGASDRGWCMSARLVEPQGQVVGGEVVGPMVAAGPVVVVAATFAAEEAPDSPEMLAAGETCAGFDKEDVRVPQVAETLMAAEEPQELAGGGIGGELWDQEDMSILPSEFGNEPFFYALLTEDYHAGQSACGGGGGGGRQYDGDDFWAPESRSVY